MTRTFAYLVYDFKARGVVHDIPFEAMACGCPDVAVIAPMGIAEVLDHGVAGPARAAWRRCSVGRGMAGKTGAAAWLGHVDRTRRQSALSRTLGAYVDFLSADLELALRDRTAG